MKLSFNNSPTIASDGMAVSTMGIAEGAGDMLSSYPRDKIYTDKILACVRETITNSQDEHIKHGIDRAVDVKIENVNGQYIWSSRDYAKGLSETSIRTVYGMYGGSDKRNNNKQIGGFGIGALSPFAFTDTFYVTSYHEGFKTQYACILGAGTNGVSVGEIYKVSDPEPTTETGLEVSLDVTKAVYDFDYKTEIFDKRFLPDANIVYTRYIEGAPTITRHIKPVKPLITKTVGEYVVNLYDINHCDFQHYGSDSIAIRMGGVIYKETTSIYLRDCKNKIVVDVPIGKLTIPISREDIENTENNAKVLKEIQSIIDDIREEEISKISTPSFGELHLANSHQKTYDGEWLKLRTSELFPDSWKLARKLNYLHSGYPHNVVSGKYAIYLIPDIKSYKSWLKRLDAYVSKIFPNTQIIWMSKEDIKPTDTLNLSDIVFFDVKRMGIPKLPKEVNEVEYLVYLDGYKKGSYTAEGLDEYVTENYFKGEDLVDGWENKVTSSNLLKKRVIGLASEVGTSNSYWVCNSKRMYEQLIELGWFTPNSKEYADRLKEIREEEKRIQDMENAEYRVKSALFRLTNPSKRTVTAIGKDPKKLVRLEKIKSNLMKEDSFRGRILKSMDNYNSKVTREDLRKLLTMK